MLYILAIVYYRLRPVVNALVGHSGRDRDAAGRMMLLKESISLLAQILITVYRDIGHGL